MSHYHERNLSSRWPLVWSYHQLASHSLSLIVSDNDNADDVNNDEGRSDKEEKNTEEDFTDSATDAQHKEEKEEGNPPDGEYIYYAHIR